MSLKKMTTRIEQLRIRYEQAKRQVKQDRATYSKLDDSFADCVEAQDIIQALGQTLQEQAHKQISSVVSKCLAAVFEEPYEFLIEFERKRNRTSASLKLKRDGQVLDDVLDSAGGGVADVAAFALRISCLLLSKPSCRRLVVLDEPFKFLHPPERRPRAVAMLEMLSEDFGIQFLMVTGIDELICGHVVEL